MDSLSPVLGLNPNRQGFGPQQALEKKNVLPPGFEPESPAWKAEMLTIAPQKLAKYHRGRSYVTLFEKKIIDV